MAQKKWQFVVKNELKWNEHKAINEKAKKKHYEWFQKSWFVLLLPLSLFLCLFMTCLFLMTFYWWHRQYGFGENRFSSVPSQCGKSISFSVSLFNEKLLNDLIDCWGVWISCRVLNWSKCLFFIRMKSMIYTSTSIHSSNISLILLLHASCELILILRHTHNTYSLLIMTRRLYSVNFFSFN